MACYSNCAVLLEKRVSCSGLISPSTLFRTDLTLDGCQSQGSYRLEGVSDVINIRGCITAEIMSLPEYARATKEARAVFRGLLMVMGLKGKEFRSVVISATAILCCL